MNHGFDLVADFFCTRCHIGDALADDVSAIDGEIENPGIANLPFFIVKQRIGAAGAQMPVPLRGANRRTPSTRL